MYQYGNGVAKSVENALKWYDLAARQGYVDAQNNLAILYLDEAYGERDLISAFVWFKIAADAGDQTARSNLAIVLPEMRDTDLNEARRRLLACQETRLDNCGPTH